LAPACKPGSGLDLEKTVNRNASVNSCTPLAGCGGFQLSGNRGQAPRGSPLAFSEYRVYRNDRIQVRPPGAL
jgi:hypothetical protein